MTHDLLTASATDLASRMKAGALRPTQVVEAHIQRIQAVNGAINAVVADRFDQARAEAAAAEQRIATEPAGSLPPLLGVPCTIKEFLAVQGMPNTGGIVHRRDVVADTDATLVARLKAAGAIVLGVTNIPEGGIWMETYNLVYGRTSNPWDPTRTSGGSSGGEGAIVAAGGVPFGIGSDVGGSIRIPAAFCGVFGHKPTGRLVPNTGYWPDSTQEAMSPFLVSGPLTRHAEDLFPILRIIAGPDGHDACMQDFELGGPDAVRWEGRPVLVLRSNGRAKVGQRMSTALTQAAESFALAGAQLRWLDLDEVPEFRQAFEIWGTLLGDATSQSYGSILGAGDSEMSLTRALMGMPFGRSGHTTAVMVLVAVERILGAIPGQRFHDAFARLRDRLDALLGDDGVLLHPPYTRPAPRHRRPWVTPFDPAHTAIFNVLEYPVTQVPMGLGPRGLPVGVQVAAARGMDHLTIAGAQLLESARGGWQLAEPA